MHTLQLKMHLDDQVRQCEIRLLWTLPSTRIVMKQLKAYASQAVDRANKATENEKGSPADEVADAPFINAILGRSLRKSHGIFFSGSDWAKRLVEKIDLSKVNRVIDPSCGIGDLLFEAALRLSCDQNSPTRRWEEKFVAKDIFQEFVDITWARLQTLYSSTGDLDIKHYKQSSQPLSFEAGDSLSMEWNLRPEDVVLMNPPFHKSKSPGWSDLSNGTTSSAALFLEKALISAPSGVIIAAILPEVIRSGSRYANLRAELAARCEIREFSAAGAFGSDADVDVAILIATTKERDVSPAVPPIGRGNCIGDLCHVSVGPVVPHRDQEKGEKLPYVDVKSAPVWETFEPTGLAGYRSKATLPPFVVVRRTSSPSDRERARSSVVNGSLPVLVENHLIVLDPKVKSVAECQRILELLRDARTSEWLNREIRCRHLTVSSVRRIPIHD